MQCIVLHVFVLLCTWSVSFGEEVMLTAQKPHRVVYNAVPKCGGTTLHHILRDNSQKQKKFRLFDGMPFYPPKKDLIARIEYLPNENAITVSHLNFWSEAPAHHKWINMVRSPVERAMSGFYYTVDKTQRNPHSVMNAYNSRKNEPCQCHQKEFDDCVRHIVANHLEDQCGHYLSLSGQLSCFCDHDQISNKTCNAESAFRNVLKRYEFVGLTEEYSISLQMLEILLPFFFEGTSRNREGKRQDNKSAYHNSLTNTTMNGCISSEVRNLLNNYSEENREENKFYEMVKKLFWRKYVKLIH